MQKFATNFIRVSILKVLQQRSMPYYAVAAGWEVGIFDTWTSCESKVKSFSKPKYKKFKTLEEAQNFLKENGVNMENVPRGGQFRGATRPVPITRREPKSFKDAMKLHESLAASMAGVKSELKEEPVVSKVEDCWPDDVEGGDGDNDLLIAAIEEVEGIPQNSRKRPSSTVISAPSSTKTIKLFTHDSKIWEPIGLRKIGNFEFPIDCEGYVIVYTDGSCINNGQADAVAGFGVYFSEGHTLNAAMPVKGRVTNNAGEIQAAIHAIKIAKDFGIQKLCLSTDSQFLINAATAWIKGWKRRGWKLKNGDSVKNVDDFIILDGLLDGSVVIKWNYVKGHKGIIGNEKADRLARKGADLYREMMAK